MASRFWVGGTGTWDAADTTHWSATSGGANGASVPGAADTVTFDALSGGGVVTPNTTINITSLTMGAFTGTINFAANNNNISLNSFNGAGTGVRTLNMGNGTWTVNGTGTIWDMSTTTNLTFNPNNSIISVNLSNASTKTFSAGTLTYSTFTAAANPLGGPLAIVGNPVFGAFNIIGPNTVRLPNSVTTVINTPFNWAGTQAAPILVTSTTPGTTATVSVATGVCNMNWVGLRDIAFIGGATFNAINSMDYGRNSGITITAPEGTGVSNHDSLGF